MYDADTHSLQQTLQQTLEGPPVIGPPAGQGISLATRDVVTTTQGGWRRGAVLS